jgi:2-oxoisovalerate dehydrogenase E1 component alpha subunit
MERCRELRKPYMIEAKVSRLYGHSSSSGCHQVPDEPDCIRFFERRLRQAGALSAEEIAQVHRDAEIEVEAAYEQAMSEAHPTIDDLPVGTYAPSDVDSVYPGDYTGLPE